MKWLLPLLLLAQLSDDAPFDLERDRQRAYDRPAPSSYLVTIIAVFPDGTPHRGVIFCDGFWFKYADEHTLLQGTALPFTTDSRGAILMNPTPDMTTLTCHATSGQRTGHTTVDLSWFPPHITTLILR